MTYSLDYKTNEVWKGDNHVLGSDYRAECLNVKAYQAYMTDPTKQSYSFFRKQNGKCRIWSKEEVRKENIKRKLLKPTIKEYLKSWYPDSDSDPEPCTMKATSYCSNMSGSFIVNAVRKLITNQPYEKKFSFNFPTMILVK